VHYITTGKEYLINCHVLLNQVSREPTVSPLGCVLEGRQSALVLEGRLWAAQPRALGID